MDKKYLQYLELKRKAQRLRLAERQPEKMKEIYTSLAKEANRRMGRLERAGLDATRVYNRAFNYTSSEFRSNRFNPYDYDRDLFIAAEVLKEFLNSPESTVGGYRKAEKFRIKRLHELDVLPSRSNMYVNDREFLKFLGREEVSAAIDEYGTSDVVVKMMWDSYKNNRQNLKILKYALLEYQAGRITFDTAMRRAGIKIEDYRTIRPTS